MRVLVVLHPESITAEAEYMIHQSLELVTALNVMNIDAFVLGPEHCRRSSNLPEGSQIISWSGRHFEQELRSIVRRVRPDVVQIENRPDMVRSARSCYNGPIVLHLYSLEYLSGHKITRRELRVALCMVDKVVVQSCHLKRLFLGRYYGLRAKTYVVYPGINTDVYKPDASTRTILREELALKDAKALVFSSQQMTAKAAQEIGVILPIWPQIHDQTGARLLVIGFKDNEIDKQHVGVCNLGMLNRHERLAVYQAADLLILPNQSGETLDITVLQAMASGLPVATSMRGGIPELVESTCGLLVRQYADTATWGRVLVNLLKNDTMLKTLGEGALKRGQMYTWESAALNILAVYAME